MGKSGADHLSKQGKADEKQALMRDGVDSRLTRPIEIQAIS